MAKMGVLLSTLTAGCFTMVNEHAARVLEPGQVEFLVGAILDGEGNGLPAFDAHLGLLPRMQVGVRWDILSMAVDTRLQVLEAEDHGVDLCLEVGAGTGFLPSPFYYGGVCVSRKLEMITPYLHVRYMEPRIDTTHQEDWTFAEQLYAYLADGLNDVVQVFVGAEIELSGGVLLVPEVVWIPTLTRDGEPYIAYNVGVRFRLGGLGPPQPPPVPAAEVAPVAPYE